MNINLFTETVLNSTTESLIAGSVFALSIAILVFSCGKAVAIAAQHRTR